MDDGPNYRAMTVNERLVEADTLDEFDAAISAGDRQRAIELLEAVDLEQAGVIVDLVLRDRARRDAPE